MKSDKILAFAEMFRQQGFDVKTWCPGPFLTEAYFRMDNGNSMIINSEGFAVVKGSYQKVIEDDTDYEVLFHVVIGT